MRAIGIILAGGSSYRMKELSTKRAVCAMPVAGSYRSIDFCTEQYDELPYPEGGCTDSVQCQKPE